MNKVYESKNLEKKKPATCKCNRVTWAKTFSLCPNVGGTDIKLFSLAHVVRRKYRVVFSSHYETFKMKHQTKLKPF